MSDRTDIRDAGAAAALAVAQQLGEQVKLHQPGEVAWLTVWARLLSASRSVGGRNGESVDDEVLVFSVPRQTGFPFSAQLKTGAVLRRGTSDDFEVSDVSGDFTNAAVFVLTCGRFVDGTAETEGVPA